MLLKQTDANEVGHVLGNPQQKLVDISAKSPLAPSWNTLGCVTLGGEGALYIAGIFLYEIAISIWNPRLSHVFLNIFFMVSKRPVPLKGPGFCGPPKKWSRSRETLFRLERVDV